MILVNVVADLEMIYSSLIVFSSYILGKFSLILVVCCILHRAKKMVGLCPEEIAV